MDNPALFVRVSLPQGHATVSAVAAARGGYQVLSTDAVDKAGRPLAPKPRVDVEDTPKPRRKRAHKPRAKSVAATPSPTAHKE